MNLYFWSSQTHFVGSLLSISILLDFVGFCWIPISILLALDAHLYFVGSWCPSLFCWLLVPISILLPLYAHLYFVVSWCPSLFCWLLMPILSYLNQNVVSRSANLSKNMHSKLLTNFPKKCTAFKGLSLVSGDVIDVIN